MNIKNVKNIFISLFTLGIVIFSFMNINNNVFANENSIEQSNEKDIFLPELNFTQEDNSKANNVIVINVKPQYDKLNVILSNLGDSTSTATVKGRATDYGTLSSKTASVPPIVGHTFTWNVPMTKCYMEYNVDVKIVNKNGIVDNKKGNATLEYSERQLSYIGWGKGSYSSRADSVNDHFRRHGYEVNVNNIYEYLNKADDCRSDVKRNPQNYKVTVSNGFTKAHRYKNINDGRFIILADSNNDILTFGR